MIPSGVEIFVGLDAIDLRWGFERLAGIVHEVIGRDARCGALFVFFGKRRTALKILFYDGTGLCLFYKRLDSRLYRVPVPLDADARSVALSESEIDALLDGIELEAPSSKVRVRRKSRVH